MKHRPIAFQKNTPA